MRNGMNKRMTLSAGKALSLPAGIQKLMVATGAAWITVNGHDVFVFAGQEWDVEASENPVVISGLENRDLVMELLPAQLLQAQAA